MISAICSLADDCADAEEVMRAVSSDAIAEMPWRRMPPGASPSGQMRQV